MIQVRQFLASLFIDNVKSDIYMLFGKRMSPMIRASGLQLGLYCKAVKILISIREKKIKIMWNLILEGVLFLCCFYIDEWITIYYHSIENVCLGTTYTSHPHTKARCSITIRKIFLKLSYYH